MYLNNRKQFASINGYKSNLADVKFGVPQGSIVGPLSFLIYINKLAIKYPEVYHFANNTDLLIFNSFVKPINKKVNYDFKKLIKQTKIGYKNSKVSLVCYI